MGQNLIEIFRQSINSNLHLSRDGKVWQLKETRHMTIKSPSPYSLGFSLDCNSSPYGSLFGSSPSLDIAKMCDGIIVLSYKNKNYIFLVEQKTKHKEDYKKQLANGKYFCDWLLVLLKEHGYYDRKVDGEVVFICLLCWQPREKSPRKGETRHASRALSKNLSPCHLFFEVKNKTDIQLLNFIK